MKYTKEILIDALQQYYYQYGFIPTKRDIETEPSYPSSMPFKYHFGSWNKALLAAGLENYNQRKEIINYCPTCRKEIITTELENKKFCSISCSAKHNSLAINRSNETMNKLRNRLVSEETKEKLRRKGYEQYGISITDIEPKKVYKKQCRFLIKEQFYKELAGYDLYLKYGKYNPKTKKEGVCMDHILSIVDGFINKINPKIISHPANCQFLFYKENISKKHRSDITLEELLKRIAIWEETHNGDPLYYSTLPSWDYSKYLSQLPL